MHCKQIAKQTRGEITEIELRGRLNCSQAELCRRKGICALSPFAYHGGTITQEQAVERSQQESSEDLSSYYEVLRFKNSLGFQWVKVENFTQAVRAMEKYREKGQPRLIRRVEYFELPD